MRPVDVGIGRLFNSIRDAIILADAETQQICLWNAAATDIFGYSTSEALGLRIEALIPEHLKPRHREGIARYAATGRGPYVDSHRLLELPALTKSGEEISIEMSLSPIRDTPGLDEGRFVLAIIRDVTERKQADEEIRRLNESLESRVLERTRQLEATLAKSRETERKLRETETKYRTVVEHLPAVAYTQLVEHNLSIAFVSPQIEAMLGYTPEEYTSRPRFWAEIIHPEDQSHVLAEDAKTDETGEPFRAEYRIFTKDGSIVWVRDEAVLVRSEEGNGLFWQGFMLDVTERKQAEQELHKGEERLRTLIRSSADVIATIKADGTVTYESDSVERVLGYKPEELIGTTGFHLVHPDDMPRAQSMFAELLSIPGATRSAEIRGRHRDGSWRYLEVTSTNLLHEPSIASIVTNYHDITERKRAEERLREAEEKYRSLVERIPAVTYIQEVGPTGDIMYVSPQMKDMLGYEPEECTSDPEHWIKILHPADRELVLAEDRRTDETGEPFSMEFRQFAKDGRVVWIHDEAAVVHDAEGTPRYWLGVQMDITERKRAEEELQEANRRLSELAVLKADFTAMVAHELDTPLAVIRGYAEMLAAGELEPAKRSHALAKIQAETEVLGALVDDVRAAATVERDDFAIKPQSVPVRTLLDAAAQAGAALPGNHPLVVENTADGRVWADPNRVGQVLRNLLSNAAKHSSENTPIELRAMPGDTPGRVRIEVVDHGFGIHPDDVSRVFEKFGRGRDRYGRKVAGIGLGLYLSRRIMQAHGSDLTLAATSEDGSVFSLELEAVR